MRNEANHSAILSRSAKVSAGHSCGLRWCGACHEGQQSVPSEVGNNGFVKLKSKQMTIRNKLEKFHFVFLRSSILCMLLSGVSSVRY